MNPDIIKMAKSMKRDYVEITNNYICGLDKSLSLFSIIYQGSNDECYYGDIGSLIKEIPLQLEDIIEIEKVRPYLNSYKSICMNISNHSEPLLEILDLKEIDGFNEVNSLKTQDGALPLKIEEGMKKYILYTFSSIHPLNKSDEISLKIFPYDNISFLCEFIINKKKYQIHEFIRYRYI